MYALPESEVREAFTLFPVDQHEDWCVAYRPIMSSNPGDEHDEHVSAWARALDLPIIRGMAADSIIAAEAAVWRRQWAAVQARSATGTCRHGGRGQKS